MNVYACDDLVTDVAGDVVSFAEDKTFLSASSSFAGKHRSAKAGLYDQIVLHQNIPCLSIF